MSETPKDEPVPVADVHAQETYTDSNPTPEQLIDRLYQLVYTLREQVEVLEGKREKERPHIRIGEIVHFASAEIGQCQAAIVVGIDEGEGFAHLAVFEATPAHAGYIRWRDYVGPGMEAGCWHWVEQCPFDHFMS